MPDHRLPLLPLILDDVPSGLRQALAQEGIPWRDRRPGPPEGRFLLCDLPVAKALPAPGQIAIDIDPCRRVGGSDALDDLVDQHSAWHEWRIGGHVVVEEVARVDKRQRRRDVLAVLRRAVETAGGIWLRVAPFPFPYRSAFNFRFDHDSYAPTVLEATLAAIAGREGATSHFINAAPFASAPGAISRMQGLDVGSHGYWHHTYRTARENIRNIERGIATLVAAGIEPSGFVAPHGRFNAGLLEALETLAISHSSEFGLAYDELPFWLGSGLLLQIPVHPVCFGLFRDALKSLPSNERQSALSSAARAFGEHLAALIRSRHLAGEPALIYGHPAERLDRHPEILRRAFETADSLATMWKTTLTELAAWWRVRSHVRLTVHRRNGRITVSTDREMPYPVGVEYLRGDRVALMPLGRSGLEFSPGSLAYERRGASPPLEPVRIDRREGFRGRVRRMIDWELVTPLQEIPVDNWRNLAKRTIRRWWIEHDPESTQAP